jgi:hypothetical protein
MRDERRDVDDEAYVVVVVVVVVVECTSLKDENESESENEKESEWERVWGNLCFIKSGVQRRESVREERQGMRRTE